MLLSKFDKQAEHFMKVFALGCTQELVKSKSFKILNRSPTKFQAMHRHYGSFGDQMWRGLNHVVLVAKEDSQLLIMPSTEVLTLKKDLKVVRAFKIWFMWKI